MAGKTLRSAESDETTAQSAELTADAQKPKRTRRTKAQIDADNAASSAAAAPEKPKRTRRTKAQIEADNAAAEAAAAPEKPKRTRRTKAQIEADNAAAEASSAPEKPTRTRPAKAQSKPEKSSGDESAAPEASESARPPRKTRSPHAPIVDLSTPTGSRRDAPPPRGDLFDTNFQEEAPRKRRTRRPAESEPVASSDNLPADIQEAPAEPSRQDAARGDRSQRQPQQQQQQDERDGQRQDDEGGGRRRNKRNRKKGGGGQQQGGGQHGGQQGNQQQNGGQQGGQQQSHQQQGGGQQGGQQQGGGQQGGGPPGEPFDGMLELIGDKKFGFIRGFTTNLNKGDNDPFMPPPLIQKFNLRDGVRLKGVIKPGRKGAWQVTEVTEVMDVAPEEWAKTEDFDSGMVIYPEEKLRLVADHNDLSMRVVDLVAPIGKGQRALIVAPPRAGKTMILKAMAAGLAKNHPDVKLVALLIDERPEEVTDFRRNTACHVFASSNDFGEDNHVRVATLAFEYSRRMVEQGHDVVILLDSLTRLGRTFNLFGGNSGRTMSGGLDARALLVPRKIFGSARNIENGGSLTIVATALIETGSRMDDVIFEEFKGTGNSEIVLDRELAEQRIYPAINIRKSGTRNEDRLVAPEHLRQRHMLLRALNSRHPVEAMQALSKQISLSDTNASLLEMLVPD